MKNEEIRIKAQFTIQDCKDRENLCIALANAGYAPRVTTYTDNKKPYGERKQMLVTVYEFRGVENE